MDRSVVFLGAVPLTEDWLFPQRATMVGLAKLSETVLGTSPVVDGLVVQPTQPTSLAVNVSPGQIYTQASLDAQAFGSMPADTAHQIVKQGIQLDALRIPITPPGTVGYSQYFLVQAAFQEQDAGSQVLPYYNSANPQQPYAGPNNSGQQQYTQRLGAIAVNVKAGPPAPTGSHTMPEPDAGWVGLGWVNVANGQAVVLPQHITRYGASNRVQVKLPQIVRGVGLAYTVVTAARTLIADEAGLVVVDTTVMPFGAEVRLPAAGSVPGVPIRFRIVGRALTAPTRRDYGWAKIITGTPGDVLDQSFVYCGPNDSVELVSDGLSRWHWVSGYGGLLFASALATNLSVPSQISTFIPWPTSGADTLPAWRNQAFPTRIYIPTLGRYRVTGNMSFGESSFATPPARTRSAGIWLNGAPMNGALSAYTNEGVDVNDGHAVSFVSGPLGLHAGDYLEISVFQAAGASVNMLAPSTWISVKADIA